jgi:hypothetical protein
MIPVTISITNGCDFCFMSLFHISLLTLHVLGLHRPIIGGISSCCLYATIRFMQFLLIVCVCLRTGLWRWLYCTVRRRTQTINKHCMNQMVAYKQQLEIPPIMGLWRLKTCRVRREIWNKDIKQKSHLLVIPIVTRIEDAQYEKLKVQQWFQS